jgi:hypothetical protein
MIPVSVKGGLGGRGQSPVAQHFCHRVGITHMVRWKPLAMSAHKRAAGYNFSQPTCPEKKTGQAIPRCMPTLELARGEGAPVNTLRNFATNINLQTWQEQQLHPVRAWSPCRSLSDSAVASASELLLGMTLHLNKIQDGMEANKPCSDALVPTQALTSAASLLALDGRWHEIPRQKNSKT